MIKLEVQSRYHNYLQSIASSVPIGQRGLVHIWGRNDTQITQQMGISWRVKDPGGNVVEQYSAWEAWPYTSPGREKEFIGGRFNLNKKGVYTIKIDLLMDRSNPVIVDSYEGALCTVVEEIPPTPPEEEIPPEEEVKIPWLPIALVGGGVILATALAKPKRGK